jgi:hypothetical protein
LQQNAEELFSFEFEKVVMTKEMYQELFFQEILFYHPEAANLSYTPNSSQLPLSIIEIKTNSPNIMHSYPQTNNFTQAPTNAMPVIQNNTTQRQPNIPMPNMPNIHNIQNIQQHMQNIHFQQNVPNNIPFINHSNTTSENGNHANTNTNMNINVNVNGNYNPEDELMMMDDFSLSPFVRKYAHPNFSGHGFESPNLNNPFGASPRWVP